MKELLKDQKGNLLMEVLVVLVVIGILLTSASAFPFSLTRASVDLSNRQVAQTYASEAISAIRGIQYDNWTLLPNSPFANPYQIQKDSTGWFLTTGSETIGNYRREIIFADVLRDVNGNVASAGIVDPNTKKAEITVYWNSAAGELSTTLFTYISNWRSAYGQEQTENIIAQWLLDENSGNTAYDAIGSNHGLINGASWVPGVSNSALLFSESNSVEVPDSDDLDVSNAFTLELWTKSAAGGDLAGTIGNSVIDDLEFDTQTGSTPFIIHISGDVFAMVYAGDGRDGFIKTITIDFAGNVGSSAIDTLEFDTLRGMTPDVIHISGDIFAIAYEGAGEDGYLQTVTIDALGNIGSGAIDSLEFDTSRGRTPEIIHISGDVFAIAHAGDSDDGFLRTVTIDASGNIGSSVVDTFEFDTNRARTPDIIHISGDVFAIVYEGNGDDGFVQTVTIDAVGNVGTSAVDLLEFDTSRGRTPVITRISGDVFAIAYSGESDDGFIRTITIDSAGNIGGSTVDTLEFETSRGRAPIIIHISGDVYAIAYEGDGDDGFIQTIAIDVSGSIGGSAVDTFEFDTQNGQTPYITHISGDVFAIAYEGDGDDGMLATVDIARGINGINKGGSYGINLSDSTVSASLNGNELVSGSVDSSKWSYVAITYDNTLPSDQLKLYVDGVSFSTATYTELINVNDNPLYLANGYTGNMDEVALYNYALSDAEILAKYELYAIDPDLISDFSLNENSGTQIADTIGGFAGTMYGATWTAGVDGSALNFDGNDYVALDMFYQNGDSLPVFTVSVWYKTTVSGGAYNTNWALLDFDRSDWFDVYVRGDNGRLAFSGDDSGGVSGIFDIYADTDSNDGAWHHGVVVYDSVNDFVKFYLDGQPDGVHTYADVGPISASTTRYGFLGDGSEATSFNGSRNNRYYEGAIDELQIYYRAFTDAEVLGLYDSY